jgi:hypothetical protein
MLIGYACLLSPPAPNPSGISKTNLERIAWQIVVLGA